MKSPRKTANIAVLAAVLLTSSTRSSHACLWDRDTLVDEQRGLPEITAIIVGRYERHTPEYYERRIRLANVKLKTAKPESAKLLLDDIAVAHDRLKNYDAAIATARQKIARYGIDYRVASNLGTFYLHKKDLKQAEIWINRALKINPNAHFGREWVQLKAIKYFQNKGKKPFWSDKIEGKSGSGYGGEFYRQAMTEAKLNPNALEGIKGLIKIGDRDTPEYFLALSQLLIMKGDKNLAMMALWRALEIASPTRLEYSAWQARASELFSFISPPVKKGYFEPTWSDTTLPFDVSEDFRAIYKTQADLKRAYLSQRAYAEKWRAAFQTREREIIRGGQNPEDIALFANFYQEWSKPQDYAKGQQDDSSSNPLFKLWPLAGVALISLALLRRAKKRRRRAQTA